MCSDLTGADQRSSFNDPGLTSTVTSCTVVFPRPGSKHRAVTRQTKNSPHSFSEQRSWLSQCSVFYQSKSTFTENTSNSDQDDVIADEIRKYKSIIILQEKS